MDDRLDETGYNGIISESEVLKHLLKMDRPNNMHAAFVKTVYNLLGKMDININQHELRGVHNYCWASSPQDKVFYIDSAKKVYRCTYSVGRPKYSLFDFTLKNLKEYAPSNRTALTYSKCASCKIGGYCGGGCKLTYSIDPTAVCDYELANFDEFISNIFKPFVKKSEENS